VRKVGADAGAGDSGVRVQVPPGVSAKDNEAGSFDQERTKHVVSPFSGGEERESAQER